MNENQTIELQIKSSSESAMQSLNNLSKSILDIEKNISNIHLRLGQIDSKTKSVSTIENVLTNIYLDLGKIETKLDSVSSKSKNSIMNINNYCKSTDTSTKKLEGNFNRLNNVISYVSFKRFFQTLSSWMQDAINYTEQLNLFNVVFKNIKKNGEQTFSSLGLEATRYQNKLNEAFGTNKTETLYMQAMFESMGENAGIKEQYASIMSKTMTNLTYDLASLYNKSEKDVAEALRAGVYAGQTKPLRSYGIDVTQNTMTPLLQAMGIDDRTVSDLSYAEKEILRYIATLKQAQVAMGDMANTIESPSNQLKVFRQQLVEAKVALSSLFINAFAKILPYANAILMVIKEVSRAIASFFGIKLTDYNTSIAANVNPYEDYADSLDDVSDGAGRARKAVKELKREILGFDQINNINEPKDNASSGNSGYATSGGIDQRLLDAIRGYDNGLDKVRMKAAEIRDKIMEWLGFTKQIDPLTGEISWKFTNTNSIIYKIVIALKDIIKYGKEAISGVFGVIKKDFDNGLFGKLMVGIFESVANLLKLIAKSKSAQTIIAKLVEAFLLFKTVKTILKPVVALYGLFITKVQNGANHIKTFVNQLKGTNNYIRDADGNLRSYNKTIDGHSNVVLNANGSINKWETGIQKAKTALSGLVTSVVGIYMVHDAVKSLANDGPNVANVFEIITGGLTTISGFATIGSIFGPIGTAIGAIAGTVSTLILSLNTYNKEIDTTDEKTKKLYKSIEESTKTRVKVQEKLKQSLSEGFSEIEYYQELWKELKNISDENGNIKAGYEERANVITNILSSALGIEIKLIDNQIQGYSDLESSIQKVIDKKLAEMQLSAYEEEYREAVKKKNDLEQQYGQALTNNEKKHQKYNETIKKYADALGLSVKETEKLLKNNENFTLPQYWDDEIKLASKLGVKINDAAKEVKNLRKEMNESDKNLADSKKNYEENAKIIQIYSTAYKYALEGNYETLNDFLEFEAETYGKSKKETINYYNNKISFNNEKLKELEKNKSKYTAEEYELEKKKYDDLIALCNDKLDLINMTSITKVKQLTPEMIEKWGNLAEKSEEVFMLNFQKLPSDIQQEVVNKMQEKGYSISSELQTGISKINPNIKITSTTESANIKVGADVAEAENTINNFLSRILNKYKTSLSSIGITVPSLKETGGAFYRGSWHNIKQYANGGMPSHGSMFIAGERGAEIVGNINGRTEVLNQSQIASTIYNAMISAMSQFNSASSQIDVHVHSDEGVIVDKINQRTKQTGVCPISIPF